MVRQMMGLIVGQMVGQMVRLIAGAMAHPMGWPKGATAIGRTTMVQEQPAEAWPAAEGRRP